MRVRSAIWLAVPVVAAVAWIGWRLWETELLPEPAKSQETTAAVIPPASPPPQASPAQEVPPSAPPQPAPQQAPSPLAIAGVGSQLLRDFHQTTIGAHTIIVDDYRVTSSGSGAVSVVATIGLDTYPDWMAVADLHKADLRAWLERTAQSARGLVGASLKTVTWTLYDVTTDPLPDFDASEKTQVSDELTLVYRNLAVWWGNPVDELDIHDRKVSGTTSAPPVYNFDQFPNARLGSVLAQLRQQFGRFEAAGDALIVRDYQPVVFPDSRFMSSGVVGLLSVEEGARWQTIQQKNPQALGDWIQQAWSTTKGLSGNYGVLAFAVVDVVAKPPPGYDEIELTYLPDRRILVVRTLDLVDRFGLLHSWSSDQGERHAGFDPWKVYTPAIRMDPATTYLVPDRSPSR